MCGLQVALQPGEVGDNVAQVEIEAAPEARKSVEDRKVDPGERELYLTPMILA